MGWSDTAYKTGELNYLLDGQLGDRFPLSGDIGPGMPGFLSGTPTRADKVHVALVVLPASDAAEPEVVARVSLRRASDCLMWRQWRY